MTDNDIFTVSDLAGTDPHALWITGLPQHQQSHVWEQPQQDLLARDNQLLLHDALVQSQVDRADRYAAEYAASVASPGNPSTWLLPTPQELNQQWADLRQRDWEARHPLRARFVRWLSR